ncbi:sine oculis-binding protein homolog [Drosophila gunungcola]|uniref:sine oculis-binding protein homolog n=1 Tax=Drosophila gunungcola TaxID=103775 RepID=UPI0022E544BC|nr:sine oculis-binding protein homolog [Drosophila gunungcola]
MPYHRLSILGLLLQLSLAFCQADVGYHYNRPTRPSIPSAPSGPGSVYTGHQFSALPTIHPLPPIPALPPLPTARIPIPRIPIHPTAPAASIVSHYLPPKQVVSTYIPPPVAAPITSISFHGAPTFKPIYGPPTLATPIVVPPTGPAPLPEGGNLRIPFGKQALISPGESYVSNGRQLRQYAVIEIIDNDIDETPGPFLGGSSFFDRYGAHVGSPAANGIQIDSRANSAILAQQQLSVQPRSQGGGSQGGDAIALGSGGLGFVRLANGNVYLGSGSLGYISGQQRVASVLEARTRSESTSDALHFGHGPLGGADNLLRFK